MKKDVKEMRSYRNVQGKKIKLDKSLKKDQTKSSKSR